MNELYINPGTGPVRGANREDAANNMKQFISDIAIENVSCCDAPELDYDKGEYTSGDGRYAFILSSGDHKCEIQMPGIPLDNVRYIGSPQNIWRFPRLYVDGSSWVWCFAISSARSILTGKGDEEEGEDE